MTNKNKYTDEIDNPYSNDSNINYMAAPGIEELYNNINEDNKILFDWETSLKLTQENHKIFNENIDIIIKKLSTIINLLNIIGQNQNL